MTLILPAASAARPYQPPELKDPHVQRATLAVAREYGDAVPGLDARALRWFLYAIEHRESTFQARGCNMHDGAELWNVRSQYARWPTVDGIPHGCGLTQITGWTHAGQPYPDNRRKAPTTLDKGIYGHVAPPRHVTRLTNPFSAFQNLARFVTEEVLPDFVAIQRAHPSFSTEEVLRAVVFHWNKGEFVPYDASNCDYLCLYDGYVAAYKPAVLSDRAWP